MQIKFLSIQFLLAFQGFLWLGTKNVTIFICLTDSVFIFQTFSSDLPVSNFIITFSGHFGHCGWHNVIKTLLQTCSLFARNTIKALPVSCLNLVSQLALDATERCWAMSLPITVPDSGLFRACCGHSRKQSNQHFRLSLASGDVCCFLHKSNCFSLN